MSAAELPSGLVAALEELARVRRLLVALDFDGTLAPHVDDPELARAIPQSRDAVLRLLALPETPVALVSGRALASLDRVSELPTQVLLVGSHGVELRLDDSRARLDLSDSELARVGVLGEVLGKIAEQVRNVWVEAKPAGFALHTRLATEHDGRLAQQTALKSARARVENLTVREGKNVLEFAVRSATKGESIERLRRHTGADAVFFAGDDVTDEDAFAVLGEHDVGLKVGDGETRAQHRVVGTDEVARVLHLLADRREGRPHR